MTVLNSFGCIHKFINANCPIVYFYATLVTLVAIFDGVIFGYLVPVIARDLFSDSAESFDDAYLVLMVVARALCSIIGVISTQQTQRLCYEEFSRFFWLREFSGVRKGVFDKNLKLNTDHANGSARLALVVVNFIRLCSEFLLAIILVSFFASQLPTPLLIIIACFSPFLLIVVIVSRSATRKIGVRLTKAEWRKNALVADALNQKRSIYFNQLTSKLSRIFNNLLIVSSAYRFIQSLIPVVPRLFLELTVAGIVLIIWVMDLGELLKDEIGLIVGASVALIRFVPLATKLTGSLIFLASETALVGYFSNCVSEHSTSSKKCVYSNGRQAQSDEVQPRPAFQKKHSVDTRAELINLLNFLMRSSAGKTGLSVALKGKSGWGKSLVLQNLAIGWADEPGLKVNYVAKQDGFLQVAPALNSLPLSLGEEFNDTMPVFGSAYVRVRKQLGVRGSATLSDGETAICLLARSLVGSPNILLVDELFSSIDIDLRSEIRRELVAWIKLRSVFLIEVLHGSQEADVFVCCKAH